MRAERERVEFDLSRGLEAADAVVLFAGAAQFYAKLPGELDAWPYKFTADERIEMAAARRRLLHALLDRALDVVEIVAVTSRGSWP
jgi:hypothetical protein